VLCVPASSDDQYADAWDTGVSVDVDGEDVRFFHTRAKGVDRVWIDNPLFLAKVSCRSWGGDPLGFVCLVASRHRWVRPPAQLTAPGVEALERESRQTSACKALGHEGLGLPVVTLPPLLRGSCPGSLREGGMRECTERGRGARGSRRESWEKACAQCAHADLGAGVGQDGSQAVRREVGRGL
jgi:hypothetical protein